MSSLKTGTIVRAGKNGEKDYLLVKENHANILVDLSLKKFSDGTFHRMAYVHSKNREDSYVYVRPGYRTSKAKDAAYDYLTGSVTFKGGY